MTGSKHQTEAGINSRCTTYLRHVNYALYDLQFSHLYNGTSLRAL